jgi:hypothetical protein
MKKNLFYFLAIALPMLTSCSNDTVVSTSRSEIILPKTVKYSSTGSSLVNSFDFTYSGNRIKSITGINERTDYTYEDDFIVKEVKYNTQSGSDVKKEEYSYAYENNKLVSTTYAKNFTAKYPNGSYKERSVYTYNADGSAVMKKYYKDLEFFEAEKLGDTELERNIDHLNFVN